MKNLRSHRLQRDDTGLTLIEMVVAVGILVVVMSASLGVFLTAQKGQQVAEGTDRATQLANGTIERIRQLPWQKIGFYQNTYDTAVAQAPATVYNTYIPDSEQTVILGTTEQNTGTSIIKPYLVTDPTDSRNKFTVYTTITYGKDASLGLPATSGSSGTGKYSFKRVKVTVVWKDNNNGASHKVEDESWFAPQGYQEAPPGIPVSNE